MYRLTDHSSLPVMGYGSALSVIAGQRLGFHVSSAQGEVAARIVRLDREARPELPWALQASGAPWQVQGFELGSWLEVPLSEDAGVLSWALLLTVNQSERPLLATADFECRYGPAGVLMLTGAAQPFAVALPRQEWLQVRFEWTAHTRRVSIAAGDWVLFDQACTGFKEGSIETVKIASDWQQQLPTLNARIADIQLHAAGRLSSWTLPTSPVQEVADLHGSGGPLKVHGAPTFAVRGPHWNGDFHDPAARPSTTPPSIFTRTTNPRSSGLKRWRSKCPAMLSRVSTRCASRALKDPAISPSSYAPRNRRQGWFSCCPP